MVDEHEERLVLNVSKAQARIVLTALGRRFNELIDAAFDDKSVLPLVEECRQAYRAIDAQVFPGLPRIV